MGRSLSSLESASARGTRPGRMTQHLTAASVDVLWQVQHEFDDVEHVSVQTSNPQHGDSSTEPIFLLTTVVACFFFTTLGISTQFAISALYWQDVWGVGTFAVGIFMGIGEVLGVCALWFLGLPQVFNSRLTFYFGKPINVVLSSMGIGFCALLVTADSKLACFFGTIGMHTFNVCVHSFQAELVGVFAKGESFTRWISRAYVVKRLANCVCVFGSIVFFQKLGPQVSYQVFGVALVLYAVVLGSVYLHFGEWPHQKMRARIAHERKGSGNV